MNLLTNGVPKTVEVDGLQYNINTDFRIGLVFEEIMSSKELTNSEKVNLVCRLYYGDQYIVNADEAIKELMWFYLCGKEVIKQASEKPVSPVYSFRHDDQLIFAAFMEVYQMDLTEVKMHWWKFKALFDNLPESCQFRQVVKYRAIQISPNMGKEEKKFYREMKKLYAIPDGRTQEEKEKDFAEALFG